MALEDGSVASDLGVGDCNGCTDKPHTDTDAMYGSRCVDGAFDLKDGSEDDSSVLCTCQGML